MESQDIVALMIAYALLAIMLAISLISAKKYPEGDIRTFYFMFTTLATFIITFYSSLIVNEWYSINSSSTIIFTWVVCLISGTVLSISKLFIPENIDDLATPDRRNNRNLSLGV